MDVTCYVAACCAIQTECDECTNVYKVNSITYCCPGCKGDVLVNGLICTCTVVYSSDERHQPNCTISNKVIGDYYFGRTSWNSTANLTTSRTSLTTTAECRLVLGCKSAGGLHAAVADRAVFSAGDQILVRTLNKIPCFSFTPNDNKIPSFFIHTPCRFI